MGRWESEQEQLGALDIQWEEDWLHPALPCCIYQYASRFTLSGPFCQLTMNLLERASSL